jgi:hypothetical protein
MRKPYGAIIAGLAVALIVTLTMPSFVAAPPPPSPPVIYYVSPINRTSSTYIFIYGKGFEPFGITPQTYSANGGYSGQDACYVHTCAEPFHPSLGIADLNQGWNAGGDYSAQTVTVDGYTFTGYDYIGVVGLTWSDNLITLAGFGNALPNYYPLGYHIHNGDKILVAIFTPADGTAWAMTTYTGPNL